MRAFGSVLTPMHLDLFLGGNSGEDSQLGGMNLGGTCITFRLNAISDRLASIPPHPGYRLLTPDWMSISTSVPRASVGIMGAQSCSTAWRSSVSRSTFPQCRETWDGIGQDPTASL